MQRDPQSMSEESMIDEPTTEGGVAVAPPPLDPMNAHQPPMTLAAAIQAFERDYLIEALRACGNARTRAAARLGISRKNLWEKLRRHQIVLPPRG